jgi:hypothetical protein
MSEYRRSVVWAAFSAVCVVLSLKAPGDAPIASLAIVVAAAVLRPSWTISLFAGVWWILIAPFMLPDTSSPSAESITLCAMTCLACGVVSLICQERRRVSEPTDDGFRSGGAVT